VSANLQARLDILHPDDLAQALHQYVEKEEKQALADCVTRVLQQTQVQVVRHKGGW
jgi:predicted metalloprotease with PDZ domain